MSTIKNLSPLFIAFTALVLFFAGQHAPASDPVLQFIKDNPARASISWVRNDSVLAEQMPDRKMPLASTVKIIVALEYARQAANGYVNPEQRVALKDLENYYVKNTDGGAHLAWFEYLQNKELEKNDSVALKDVARGMMIFSSNANTEYLMDLLTLDSINTLLTILELKDHDHLYYVVSSLFVSMEFPEYVGDALTAHLREVPKFYYSAFCKKIHKKLKNDLSGDVKRGLPNLSMDLQRVWSDRLPNSTTRTYATLLKKINGHQYFSPEVHRHLDYVLEFVLDNPANRSWLEHAGMKGGSTAFVLTKATYATDKQGNKTELAYFFNDITLAESATLSKSMNSFELKLLKDPAFREEVKSVLGAH